MAASDRVEKKGSPKLNRYWVYIAFLRVELFRVENFRVGISRISVLELETSSEMGWILCSGIGWILCSGIAWFSCSWIGWISVSKLVMGECFLGTVLWARVFFHCPFLPYRFHRAVSFMCIICFHCIYPPLPSTISPTHCHFPLVPSLTLVSLMLSCHMYGFMNR